MQLPIDTTFDTLAATRNEAAAGLLIAALDSPHEAIAQAALRAILRRRSPAAHREVLARWHTFSPAFKTIVFENPTRLSAAIRDAVLSQQTQLSLSGCDAARCVGEYELIPALVNAAEQGAAGTADTAAHTLLQLAEMLHDELAAPRDWRRRRDPYLHCTRAVSALEVSTRRYGQHRRKEIVTAFLMLAGRDNGTLRRILREPLDHAHAAVVELLAHSTHPALVQLALDFLDDSRAPSAAVKILARREDDEFLHLLLEKIGADPSSGARVNLRRIQRIHWLPHVAAQLTALEDDAQQAAVQAVAGSGLPRGEKLKFLKSVLQRGRPAARRAAVAVLAEFQGVEPNRLVLRALRDEDAHVQAAALSQLRPRSLPGAMATLIDAIDSPEEIVSRAARRCLREFTFARYLSAYDGMNEEVRRSTGQLVRKVDPRLPQALRDEMNAASRCRRLRAIDVAATLEMIDEMEGVFHELLHDDDHVVRIEAAAALAECPTEKTRLALRDALLDRNAAVKNAAQRALDEMVTARGRRGPAIDTAAVQLPESQLAPGGGLDS